MNFMSCLIPTTRYINIIGLEIDIGLSVFTGLSVHGIFKKEPTGLKLPLPPQDLPTQDRTHISCASCLGRSDLYHFLPPGKPAINTEMTQ